MDFYDISIKNDTLTVNTSIFTIDNTGGRVALTFSGSEVMRTETDGIRVNTAGSVHRIRLGSSAACSLYFDGTDLNFDLGASGEFNFTHPLKIQNAPTLGQGSTPSGSGHMECNGEFWAVKVHNPVWG